MSASVDGAFTRRPNAGQRDGLGLGTGEARALGRVGNQPVEDGFKPVVAGVMHMVGFGRGEQDTIDLAGERAQQRIGLALAETSQHGGKGGFEIGHRCRTGIERAQRIHQDDLPIQPGEMIAEEGPHHLGLIGLEAVFEHGIEAAVADGFDRGRQGREGQRRRAFEIAGQEEAAGRQRGKRAVFPAAPQIVGEGNGEALGIGVIGILERIDGREFGKKGSGLLA